MRNKTPALTAHRGGTRLGPENSLTALRRAMALGVPWAEIDVQLTADGAIVVVHDEDLSRLAGSEKRVGDCTLAELRRFEIGERETIPTLEECIAVVRGRMQLMIELKDYGRSGDLPTRVVEVLREKDFLSGVRVCSFTPDLVHAAQEREPRLDAGYVLESVATLPEAGTVRFVSVAHEAVTAAVVRSAHHRDMEVHAWTVNERAHMLRLLAMGVDNLITDDPATGKSVLAEFGRKGWLARQLLRLT